MRSTLALDHLLWGVADLERGCRRFAELTGVEAVPGGTHPGFGTRNALAQLGDGVYLEIIALDPLQPSGGAWARKVAHLAEPGLIAFAVRTADLDAAREAARAAGIATGAPVPMSRTRPDGVRLEWSIMEADDAAFDGLLPFFIDWRGSPHPTGGLPSGCRLLFIAARHPEAHRLARIYAALDIPVSVEEGPPGLHARIETPKGIVSLGPPGSVARAGDPG
jgi:hypothetical protein